MHLLSRLHPALEKTVQLLAFIELQLVTGFPEQSFSSQVHPAMPQPVLFEYKSHDEGSPVQPSKFDVHPLVVSQLPIPIGSQSGAPLQDDGAH